MYTGTKVKLKLKGTKKKCKWSVNKPQIISVSQKGIVKAKKKGKAKVIAKIKKKKYICKVTVKSKKSKQINQIPATSQHRTLQQIQTPTQMTVRSKV